MTTRFGYALTMLVLGIVLVPALVAGIQPAGARSAQDGVPEQTVLLLEELASSRNSSGQVYLSAINEEQQPFTHMMLRWEAHLPGGRTHDHDEHHEEEHAEPLTIEVRTSQDNQEWSAWTPTPQDDHLWMPKDGEEVFWSQIIYAGEDARYWQVRALATPTEEGAMPTLHRIEVNTVDARYGRDSEPEELPVPRLESVQGNSVAAIDRPPVVSRSAWGCPDGQGSRVPPDYYPANHMVVHHTVDPNTLRSSEQNWGDRVRAIWSFHTLTRGWGDVGYNYLIAPDGTIYEGRAGGDDAVGFHDTGNYGSMGVSLIGTYQNDIPSPATQDSLVLLLAWKAVQKGIDPLGSSYYYGCEISSYCGAPGAVVYNISGHRQISYATSCPGDAAFDILPTIRQRVQKLIDDGGFAPQPDNGDLVIDELESSFARSDANWYTAVCGYGGHTYYTFATDSAEESTNNATWQPEIPENGRYRVYAHIPQNCGLADPPYASVQATYRIRSAEGDIERSIDHNTAEEWVDLGAYNFNAGSDGFVELTDLSGEPYSERKIIFFDTVKWVYEAPSAGAELLDVRYSNTEIAAGDLLEVTFTVKNNGDVTIYTQDPQAGTRPDGSFDPANGYVYDENECFMGSDDIPDDNQKDNDTPIFAKETDRFRVMLGATNRDATCAVEVGGYPWRWGLDGKLEPGETRDITGYIRFTTPGTVNLQAGIIQEFVRYHVQDAAQTTIEVQAERQPPVLATYNEMLEPMAHVYKLGNFPDNFLARTKNPLSIPRGDYIGSFAWDGSQQTWEEEGPLGQRDQFLVEQTRVIKLEQDGTYDFRTTTNDGSWLWVDDQLVVDNSGLHEPRPMTGTVELKAGLHVLSFRYFDRASVASIGYDMRGPDSDYFAPPVDGLSTTPTDEENIFETLPTLILAAHDQGSNDIAYVRYSWDGEEWEEVSVTDGMLLLNVAEDAPCTREATTCAYRLRYQAGDRVGNTSQEQELHFAVRAAPLPIATDSVTVSHTLTSTTTVSFTTDTGQQTLLDIPPGALSSTTTLSYAELPAPAHTLDNLPGIAFGERAFTLKALDDAGEVLEQFRFNTPVTVTTTYSTAAIDSPEALRLFFWDGSTWRDAAQTCSPASAYSHSNGHLGVAVCTAADGTFPTEFVLVEQQNTNQHMLYMPMVQKQ